MRSRAEWFRELGLDPETNGSSAKPETFTAADLMALELPPVKWIVPGILPEGVTLLAGKPKLGKSWLAFGMAIAVASGGVVLGTRRVEQGEALYLALEDNQRRLQKRLGKLLSGDAAPEGLHISTTWPRIDQGGEEALEEWIADRPGARLVVVDVLKRVRPRTTRYQSVYDADYESLEALHAFADRHGIAVLCIHHLRKAGADDPLDEISGSTGLSGAADGVLLLKRDRGRGDAYLQDRVRSLEEANRENRRIITALTQRIPEIEAPRDHENAPGARGSPEAATEQPGRVGPQTEVEGPREGAEPRSWWSPGGEGC
jgi:hypothetical protein